MRYIIRALKYFIQISFIFAAIIGVLMLAGWVSTDINIAIRGGWRSVGYIALIFAAFSCLYPRLGYTRRIVEVPELGDAAVPDAGAGGKVPDAGGKVPDAGGQVPDAGGQVPELGDAAVPDTRAGGQLPELGDAAVPDARAGGQVPKLGDAAEPDAGGHYLALIDEAFRFRGYEKATPNRTGEDPNPDREDPNRDGEKDPAGATCFVARYRLISRVNRAARLWEDTITVRRVAGGYEFEGLAKDLARVVSSVELRLRA